MVISNPDAVAATTNNAGGDAVSMAHPSGIPRDRIDNIMSGIANTGDVKMNNHRKKLRQRFDIIKKLGQGTYGKVQLGINKETGQEVAIKTIKKCKIEAEADLVRIRREVQIMSSVQHPNIIHIYEVFENREKMVLVMEFAAGGELYDYLSERKVLSEEEARRIFRQVATAVYYCHKHKICHRDLKLENILLDEHGNAKIADFGLSNVFDEQNLLATFCGSPLYASPEIVEGTPYQGPEVDCWSLGVLLYTLVYGSMPFDGSNFKRLVKQISQGDYYEPKKPSRASSLIRDMLTVSPRKRATIEQICAHWWVNENDNVSCLDLAEELATQTPVRLDVLLSLTPAAVTADQLVVPSADAGKGERVPRSHSVGSIRDMGGNTEAERRILDMVAAGGEAALMPSPTRTITPTHSPVQSKRKLETTVSTENAHGAALKKKDKLGSSSMILEETTVPLTEETPMETEEEDEAAQNAFVEEPITPASLKTMPSASFSQRDMEMVGDLCEQLIQEESTPTTPAAAQLNELSTPVTPTQVGVPRQKTIGKLESLEETPEEKDATKVIKKFVNKHKTADLVNAIGQIAPSTEKAGEQAAVAPTKTSNAKTAIAKPTTTTSNNATPTPFVRKCSLQDEGSLSKFNADRRKSRVLETTEKLQQMNTGGGGGEKPKKFSIPGVSVGSYKKEFERKATNPSAPQGPTPGELRALEEVAAAAAAAQELETDDQTPQTTPANAPPPPSETASIEASDSKNSVASLSLDDARRSMENSIALLRQAQSESSKEVDQLCAQTENIEVSETGNPMVAAERERKLKNARAIIGNAIQPVIRRPPSQPSFGIGGGGYGQMRAASGGFIGFGSSGSGSSMSAGMGGGGAVGVGVGGGGGIGGGNFGSNALPPQMLAYNMSNLPQTPPPLLTPNAIAKAKAKPNANANGNVNANAALAAARQHIMGRLAANAGDQQNEFQYKSAPSGYFIQSPPPSSCNSSPLYNQYNPNNSNNNNNNAVSFQYQYKQNPQQPQPHQQQQQQQQKPQPQQQKQQPHQYQHTNLSPQATQNQLLQFQQRLQQLQQQRQRHHQSLIEQQEDIELEQQQYQQHQKQALSQQPLHQYQSKPAHSMSMPHTLAASATATAANVKNTAISSTAATANSVPKPFYNAPPPSIFYKSSPGGEPNNTVKTSTATITLKSATLPRRKPTAKTEIQLEIKPRIVEQPNMRFTTEMQHPVADLRSAPAREGPAPYSPIKTMLNARATSLEPKEHIIQIQRPQAPYTRTTSNTTTRSGSLSRQSTNDSESDTTTTANMSQSTVTGSSQPIKKSPREFIIPIAMEGGGFITPREGSIEPSESSHTASSRSAFNRLRPTRRIGSSLLNDSGIDDNSPFQKFRTSSGNREGDEEPRFTLHRLRSSRPVKKLSQENDSQSSGEEDDDDGFEILTAENLFSTLLQRVHALTHRMNVDKDLTAGFPNSSRLLSNMRHGPFWNQEPFGRSQVSYTYSETVEKKQVRLNSASGNNVGAPWRRSMSRDLSNDMDSIFSRTGATLPRGTKTSTKIGRPATIAEPSSAVDGSVPPALTTDEPLDLADLDLSRLRLSKKDLETLSSITPGLPKCFQEQLLAKLPPTQARKLSRTLSMQSSTQTAPVKIYKRSQSGGRGVLHTAVGQDLKENFPEETASSSTASKRSTDSSERRHYDPVYRRSLSRSRYDYESSIPSPSDAMPKSRSSSVCRDDHSKSMCSTYTTDINDRYKYYSPYLSKPVKDSSTESGSVSPQKLYSGGISAQRDAIGSAHGRPPSGCLSPPIITADGGSSSLRRRSSQKRISRFLRPDFFDEPLDENPFLREKKQREREAQNVLREIREKSREPSRERSSYSGFDTEDAMARKHSLPSSDGSSIPQNAELKHVRNKSMEMYAEYQPGSSSSQETIRHNRRSLSRPREITEELRKNELADKILEELQLLSAARTQQEQQKRPVVPREISVERCSETSTKSIVVGPNSRAEIEEQGTTSTIKKIKKIKPKDKSTTTESSTDADATVTTSVVKKVKKIVKKTETTKTILNDTPGASLVTPEDNPLTPLDIEQTKKESKLKRPKSYPTKEPPIAMKPEVGAMTPKLSTKPTTIPEMSTDMPHTSMEAANVQSIGLSARESRLVRPKSYPTSKLTPPKESKKVTRSGAAIPTIAEAKVRDTTPPLAIEEKFEHSMPISKAHVESSSSSDTKPTTIKKIIKVSKKSKLAQPLPVTPTTPTSAMTSTTTTPAENSKESSPAIKEKSPEKKQSKGLLYAIGQKFEKLRDSAMSKEKKSITSSPASSANGSVTKKRSPENASPEKIKEKSTLLKKKKSLDGTTTKTDKYAAQGNAIENNASHNPLTVDGGEVKEKPAKPDKRSRIDSMIRSLRERSVPRSRPATENSYIKRAVSVEEMPGTFNKTAVNRVLGLFKRVDKDVGGAERRVQSTRSTSNIERQMREASPSPIYQNTAECQRSGSISAALAGNLVANSGGRRKSDITAKCSCDIAPTHRVNTDEKQCVDCLQDAAASLKSKNRDEKIILLPSKEVAQGNKDKRKGLMLDLSKLDKTDNNATTNRNNLKAAYINGNGIYSNLPPYPGAVNSSSNNSSSQQSMDNATNNNNSYMTNNNSSMQTSQTSGYRTSSTHEINRNHLLTPSTENIANYSSDSRSYQDDCASTSTFLSPTEEPELYFDNWSVCSEDNYMLHASPSPTVSRLSRASQLSSPTRGESSDPNESVIDRIKRRSFYCRFNDKKPKRTSSIVGPSAVRDYYREQQAAVKARSSNKLHPNERTKSPDITQEFFRPLKLSPVGTELKPPIYKAPLDYATNITKPRKSLNDIRPITSPSLMSKRYGSTADTDYMTLNSGVPIRYKSSASSSPYESKTTSATSGMGLGTGAGVSAATGGAGGSYYNTYSPKRRSSYTFNGTLPSGATLTNSTLDGYATVGRRPIRAYDHRTISLLDPTTSSPSTAGASSYRREARTPVRDYTSGISRSNSRYRTSSASRSPTNI
ncbi:serine/arginine repetitive matrix protein 2 isoform X1 [Anastrepha obliqua]|uniref:serine/arginine repetitive matrix protein 2 isoform X1 n=1 Tax=Anastrepha obliqua TaxID=95512 RepID=UPI00240A2670|nr:serine/arginine repetitive matrix protein 2 isoform X1 [Anastrepha obliqua]XP_054726047.1 serine/arginine repetitive matrix protein 2 isoform X1 [Anastrepha obliqua]XP_054726056.1 serine/arginine repetitive matrix protein 2 isoform X1 [Anastrepha obliqua]XP_054726066.1 serine/arginine repetitive matrix protein 2 isoform X1 [Anastrepha obliqua]